MRIRYLPVVLTLLFACQADPDDPAAQGDGGVPPDQAFVDSGFDDAIVLDAGLDAMLADASPWGLPDCPYNPGQVCWGFDPELVPTEIRSPGGNFDHMGCLRPNCNDVHPCPEDLVCLAGYIPSEPDSLDALFVDGGTMCIPTSIGRLHTLPDDWRCHWDGDGPMFCAPGGSRCFYPEVLERWPILESLRVLPAED